MPYKVETLKLKLENAFLKRSAKLLPCQKEMIIYWHTNGLASITGIAKIFKVNKRAIQFILFPERLKRNKELRDKRGGSKQYYKGGKEWSETIKEHRHYKHNTLKSTIK